MADAGAEITVGALRAAGKRLHVVCHGCGWERELRLDRAPLASAGNGVTLSMIQQRIKCSQCGEQQKVWLAEEVPYADAASRREWGWTVEEIAAAREASERG